MEPTEWVWLKHEGHDGLWQAPEGVVEDMADKGWYPTDERPVEANPALAERPAEWWDPIPGPEQIEEKPTRKSKKSTEDADTTEEGSDSVG